MHQEYHEPLDFFRSTKKRTTASGTPITRRKMNATTNSSAMPIDPMALTIARAAIDVTSQGSLHARA